MNLDKTILYYQKDAEVCDCGYCKAYIQGVKSQYKKLTDYLESCGIDVTKPFEAYPGEESDTHVCFQEVQYVVLGKLNQDFKKTIGPVTISVASSHPTCDLKEPFSILSISPIRINK